MLSVHTCSCTQKCIHTHTHRGTVRYRSRLHTQPECGSQRAVCCPLWSALHETSPPLISRSPAVQATHRPLCSLISLCDIFEAQTFTDLHTHIFHGLWTSVFIYLSAILCELGVWLCMAFAIQHKLSHHFVTVADQ